MTWHGREIENAIADFVRDGVWPSLEYRECLHLLFRLHVAQKLIVAVLSNTAQGKAIAPALPDLQNRSRSAQWFLLHLWNMGGKAFLSTMADDWLRPSGNALQILNEGVS